MPSSTALPAFVHHFVDTGITRVHCAELRGAGPPLMLIHGIGMDWRVWQAISRHLHQHFRLFMLDLRGHGMSGKPPTGYSLAAYASDVEDVVDALSLRDVSLVGSSLGAMVTAAVEAPRELINCRVLVDPPLTGGPIRDAEMFSAILGLKHQPTQNLARFLGKYNPGSGEISLRTMSEMWQEAADHVIVDMLADPHCFYDLDSALPLIDAPVLLIGADPANGAVLSEVEARRALDLLPDGHFIVIPGASHAVHASKPSEFARIILSFTRESVSTRDDEGR